MGQWCRFFSEQRTPNLVPLLAINWGGMQSGLFSDPRTGLEQRGCGSALSLPVHLHTCISIGNESVQSHDARLTIPTGN